MEYMEIIALSSITHFFAQWSNKKRMLARNRPYLLIPIRRKFLE